MGALGRRTNTVLRYRSTSTERRVAKFTLTRGA
jgi:hypothetical protein